MHFPGGNGNGRAAGTKVHGRDGTGSLVVSNVFGVAIPELSIRTDAPAANASVVEDGAGVFLAGADCNGGPPGADIHRSGVRRAVVARPRIASTAAGVAAPAKRGPVIEDGARMDPAGCNGNRRPAGPEFNGWNGSRGLVISNGLIRRRSQADRYRRRPQHRRRRCRAGRTCGKSPAGDRNRRATRADIDRVHRAGRLVVADGVGVAVAELAISVTPSSARCRCRAARR